MTNKITLKQFIDEMNNTQNRLYEFICKEEPEDSKKGENLAKASMQTLLIGIFKLQAKDITEDYLFEYLKVILNPSVYKMLYHSHVLKDSVNCETNVPLEAELDTFEIKGE